MAYMSKEDHKLQLAKLGPQIVVYCLCKKMIERPSKRRQGEALRTYVGCLGGAGGLVITKPLPLLEAHRY